MESRRRVPLGMAGIGAVLGAALEAQAAGLAVVPPSEDGSKAPLDGRRWKQYQTRRPTTAEIEQWYRGGRSGLGLVCGNVSGNLETLEFEEEPLYQAFIDAADGCGLGELVDRIDGGYSELSGGGGIHWLYRCAEITGNIKLAQRPKRLKERQHPKDDRKTLIETRGEGGFIIVAPSNGTVHPSGDPYVLLHGGFASIATITPDERAELHRLARTLDQMPRAEPQQAPRVQREPSGDHLRPGDDYNARTGWAEILEPAGWTFVFQRGAEGFWRRPGKQRGISATTGHDGSDNLHVFTTSTVFEPVLDDARHAYDRFGAYAVLHHGGDLEAAGRELYQRGYGDHRDHHGRPCRPGCPNPPEGIPKPTPAPPDDGWDWPPEATQAGRPPPEPDQHQAADVPPSGDEPPALLPIQTAGTKPDRPRPETLVDGLLQQGELLVLGAARGIGKSWWGMALALLLAQGRGRVMGTFTVRRSARVLYAHGEIDDWTAYDRWERLCGEDASIPEGLRETFEQWRIRVVTKRVTTGFTSTEFIDAALDGRLEHTIIAERIEVLIVDPWAVFYAGRENSNDEVEAALGTLRALQLRYGLTVALLHHFGKANETRDPEDLWRGASRLADWASTRVTLSPYYTPTQIKAQGMTRHQARQYAKAQFLRRAAPAPEDLALKWNPETGHWERWRAPEDHDSPTGMYAVDVADKCPPEGWPSMGAAAAALGVSEATARKLLEQAKAQGLLEDFDGPRRARGWRRPGPKLEGH